mgnify:CR=1 FL=1
MVPSMREVPLGSSASVTMRPALYPDLASAEIESRRIVGVLQDGASFGEIYGFAVPTGIAGMAVNGLQHLLTTVELGMICIESIAGVEDVDGSRPDRPTRAVLARMLLDIGIASRIRGVLFERIHAEQDEGNGSTSSSNGAQPAGSGTAKAARRRGSRAPAAGAGPTAGAVPKSSIN